MNRNKLLEKVAHDSGLNKAQSRRAIEALLSTISRELKERKVFEIRNFGIFRIEYRKPRRYYSPVTDQFTEIRKPVHIGFRASGRLKKEVKQGKH